VTEATFNVNDLSSAIVERATHEKLKPKTYTAPNGNVVQIKNNDDLTGIIGISNNRVDLQFNLGGVGLNRWRQEYRYFGGPLGGVMYRQFGSGPRDWRPVFDNSFDAKKG
jgi:hypothetical protein